MDEDLKRYLEQSRADMAEMKQMVKGIKNHFIRAEIYQWVIVALVVIPSIVAVFLLLPQINQYQQILSAGLGSITGSDLNLLK
jgi:hypothetical protein